MWFDPTRTMIGMNMVTLAQQYQHRGGYTWGATQGAPHVQQCPELQNPSCAPMQFPAGGAWQRLGHAAEQTTLQRALILIRLHYPL